MDTTAEQTSPRAAAVVTPRKSKRNGSSRSVHIKEDVSDDAKSPSPLLANKSIRKGEHWKPHTHAHSLSSSATANNEVEEDVWDISRLNKHWEIDSELKRSLPHLARSKRNDKESAADKFLRLSKIPLPTPPQSEAMLVDISTPHMSRQQSQRAMITPETKAKYFGSGARDECHSIFRKLAAQKYLTTTPINQFLKEQQVREEEQRAVLGSRTATPALPDEHGRTVPPITHLDSQLRTFDHDRKGLFTRQFTARHKFTSMCLEKDLPPCIRLIMRNYFSPEINVSHMSIGDELAVVFAECLLDLPMVTGLNARNNRLGDRGIQAIIDVVVSKKDLYHLDLSENKVDGDASASLAAYLAAPKCALQSLKLSHADVDDGELAPFAKALHANKSLQVLDMSRNLIGNTEMLNIVQPSIVTGGEALATMLSINYTLTFLDLSWNYLRLGGAVEIGRSLAYNNGIRELNLAYNAFGNTGAQAIGEALMANATLAKLNLSNNNIPSQGAQAIASALKVNSSVTWLNLDGNPLGQTGGRALLHAVAACTDRQLQVLMEGCNFDLAEADAFDPSESTGTYELNMAIPYERAIALELLRVANTKQGCKFLSIIHTSTATKQKRNIKVELRESDTTDARRRLLKTAGILTDPQASEEELKLYQLDHDSLASLFRELDQDNSGFIDEKELKRGMQRLGLIASNGLRDEDIARCIAQYDLDGTGTIELDEFIELMASFNLDTSEKFSRQVYDVDTNLAFEIPTEGLLHIEFVDFHVSVDHDNAHSHAGVERLIDNISNSKNKSQMLEMAKSGLYFRAPEAQLLLDSVSDVFEITHAVSLLLPNMVDPKNAYLLIDQNLTTSQRVRLQHLMAAALQPMLGLATGHYKVDLGNDLDRLTLKKLVENSNRTAFLRKKQGLKDTSQHGNYHGFRNEILNGKPLVLEPSFLDTMPKFGMVEFDYAQLGRTPPAKPMSAKRFEQLLRNLQLEQMSPSMGTRAVAVSTTPPGTSNSPDKRKTPPIPGVRGGTAANAQRPATAKPSPFPPLLHHTKDMFSEFDRMKMVRNYVKFGDGLNSVVDIDAAKAPAEAVALELDDDDDLGEGTALKKKQREEEDEASLVITRNGKETTTARRLLFNLQWYLCTRWLTAQQAIRLLSLWPQALATTRIEAVCIVFDRLIDLYNFNGILSALTEYEVAQCFYRIGWLNLWSPFMVDNYYELHLALYEEREIAKSLVRLAIDEPGENWQRETFGWSRDELIPGWELNLSWLKDGGFPEKGYLCLEYYSGADKGCGPVWPTRRELASSTLAGLPPDEALKELELHVDSMCMMKRPSSHSAQ